MSDVKASLLKSAQEAVNIAKGRLKPNKVHKILIPGEIDVRSIRHKMHLSRTEFSERFGFKLRTLEKWEQHVTTPDSSARAYLTVISRNAKAVEKALMEKP